jgi:prepilin-type N-terminal cleavage/methylation domain-containing protein
MPYFSPTRSRGFTLIELTIVIMIIGVIAAIAAPQLLPILLYSGHEGAARRLAQYGRAAIAQAAVTGDAYTVRIDLDNQEYYTVRWIEPTPTETEGEFVDQFAMMSQLKAMGITPDQLATLLAAQRSGAPAQNDIPLPKGFDPAALDKQFGDKFDRIMRRSLEARAKNVPQDEGILSEIGPLFDKPFSLEEQEPSEEEVTEPVLQRQRLPEGIYIESVVVNGETYSKGLAEIRVGPGGLLDTVTFYIRSEDGSYFTVFWDAAHNLTDVAEGYVS